LKGLQAQFCQYKVCSTFDSSPLIGSIGRAMEIGVRAFRQKSLPLIIGAPQLKRYTFAGHLFANYQGETYRIDRHPVMSRHPVTPMHEADLRLHLRLQTTMSVSLVTGDWPAEGVAILDVHDDETQLRVGRQLLALPNHARPFVVGSSGFNYALLKAQAEQQQLPVQVTFDPPAKLDAIVAVSGSVSPTTERQIHHALVHGFAALSVPAVDLAQEPNGELVQRLVADALAILAQGQSPLILTACGETTDASARLNEVPGSRRRIGEALGQILRDVLARSGIRRAVIAGGDTSGHALSQLDIFALKMRYPLVATPGSPLCVAQSTEAKLNGLELALKGGQVGHDGYFSQLRDGAV
jgi:3-oxoisoapionate kinase